MQVTLILGSSSPFRKKLLDRLQLDYQILSPDIDETRIENETPADMVKRLSLEKAKAIAKQQTNALIIGSDQCAVLDNQILGKPNNHDTAIQQLAASSGKEVNFLTGLCLYNSATQAYQLDVVHYGVKFRQLSFSEIDNYLKAEKPYNCAGSFKSEGLGITLFERFIGDDPTALIGLPLIRLTQMLRNEGINLP